MRMTEWLIDLARDTRYATRALARRPVFTSLTVLTLAIGIGATTTIFSAVDVLLLRPLPYARPQALMKVSLVTPPRGAEPSRRDMVWSYPKFVAFRDHQHVFTELALYVSAQFTVGSVDPERVSAEFVGATYLRVLGVKPIVGRDFDRDVDAHADAPRQAIISYSLWERRFNADRSVVGRTVDINYQPYVVVGVTPLSFRGLTGESEMFVPITTRASAELNQAQFHEYWLIARRMATVSAARATDAVGILGREVSAAHPNHLDRLPWGALATPLDDARLDPRVRLSLLVLFGAVGFVLLLACVNVANLQLARASMREREMAARFALGAARGRLIRLVLTESVLISLSGGLVGVLLAAIGVRVLGTIDPATVLRESAASGVGAVAFTSISLDLQALLFTLGITLGVGIGFGLVPALGATREAVANTLKAARHSGGVPASVARRTLVVTQVTLALTLLAGAGLMMRSLGKLLATPIGFDSRGVLTFRIAVAPNAVPADSQPLMFERVLDRLRAIPGVTNASLSNCPPLGGGCSITAIQFHDRPKTDLAHSPEIGVHLVTAGWISTLKVPLRGGRDIAPSDRAGASIVTVVNETAARRFWPGQNPIGKRVALAIGGGGSVEVVGVIGDVRQRADSAPGPEAYLAFAQLPRSNMMVFVRTTINPASLGPEVRRAVREIEPRLPIYGLRTMNDWAAGATAPTRFSATVLSVFAITALTLAVIGIYGVIALAVAARTRELGIRIALGADRAQIARLVIGDGAKLVAIGVTIGIAGALAATRVLGSLLYDTAPTDPLTYGMVVAVLAVAALVASWIPARRASHVDPATVLRSE